MESKKYEIDKERKTMSGYLFVHFIGEEKDGEQIYFSVSEDGLFWTDLNGGKPVLYSTLGENGARDPFLVRDPEKHCFYLMATDLRIEAGKGWETAQYSGSRKLLVWESADLVHWSKERAVTVGVEAAGCVWAPEAIYVEEKHAFLVFWASMICMDGREEPKQRIYASWTEDFRNFEPPFVMLEKENHVIDTTMTICDGFYYRFSKDETTKRILEERSRTLNPEDFESVESPFLSQLPGVEGPEIYQLPDGSWCLIVDQYAKGLGYLPLISQKLAEGSFTPLPEGAYDLGKTKKRHGGVLKLTDQELQLLKAAYGC